MARMAIVGLDLIHGAVRVAQDGDLTDTEYRGGGSQFRFTNAADFNRIAATFPVSQSGRVLRVWP